MKLCVFNGGKLASIEGAVVRYRNLVINPRRDCHTTWIDPVYYKSGYKTEDLDTRVPPRVTFVPGHRSSKNPAVEWLQREHHYLKHVKRADFDVGLFYNAWGTFLARQWIRARRKPLVFDYIDFMHEFRANPLERTAVRKATAEALRSSDLVVTTAHRLLEDAKQFNPNTILVPNGVDVQEFRKAKPVKIKHPAVGFAGGLGTWVDVDKVLHVAERHPEIWFYFVGDGPKRPRILELIREKKLKNVYLSEGFVPHSEIRNWMAAFDVCVIPFALNKLTDAVCPIKLFEYWSLEKPVIAAPTYEIKRIAGGRLLFAHTNEQWEEAVLNALGDAKLARRLGKRGYELAREHYDWRVLSKTYVKALRDVIAEKSR